jgi:DNA-binding NarL/FixJ family response regulator
MTASILLVDDHPAILLGLECLFSADPDFEVVGAVQDPRTAVAAFARTLPDLVVLDLSMPGQDGEEVMRELRALQGDCRILVLTSSVDPATVHRVVQAGADGYQLKDSPSASLLEAARSVLRGESPIDARVTRSLLGVVDWGGGTTELTERERDVLRLVSLGLANKQIALRLGIGVSTVKTHLSSVFQRIGVADRTSAAMWARTYLAEQDVH